MLLVKVYYASKESDQRSHFRLTHARLYSQMAKIIIKFILIGSAQDWFSVFNIYQDIFFVLFKWPCIL